MGWGTGNIGGGSGGGLNFKVVGNPQPTNPKENTIWLNTDVDITGCSFRAERPEGMAEGEVWISTGTESQVAFNALKKSTIMVYPLAAKQMQGGTLVDVTAQSYQNGAWVDWWNGELYDKGNEFKNFTGGWVHTPMPTDFFGSTAIAKTSESIKLDFSGSNRARGVVHTANKIDLTNFSTLKINIIDCAITGATVEKIYVGACENSAEEITWDAYKAATRLVNGNTGVVSVDIFALEGEHYVSVGGAKEGGTSAFHVTFNEVWCE